MYDQIFQAVKTLATAQASPFTAIDNGSMPEENGLAMYLGPGFAPYRFLDKGGIYDLVIALNGKHQNLGILLPAMSNIHMSLNLMRTYPSGPGWKILDIETATPPNYLDQEPSGTQQWLYGSLLRVKFYVEGKCN